MHEILFNQLISVELFNEITFFLILALTVSEFHQVHESQSLKYLKLTQISNLKSH